MARSLYLPLVLIVFACGPTPKPDPPPSTVRSDNGCPSHAAHCDPQLRRILGRAGVEPKAVACNTLVRWEPSLARYARRSVEGLIKLWKVDPGDEERRRAIHHVLGFLVRTYFDHVTPQNLGVTPIRNLTFTDSDGKQRPVLLFRSAVTTSPNGSCACFESLLNRADVRHVVNLYGGSFPFRDMILQERMLAQQMGATYFDAAGHPELRFRPLVEHEKDYEANKRRAMENLARLIREHVLRPEGKAPHGNVYIHCGGGMHRSGMLFGVVQRCVNGEPMSEIVREYKRHTGYISHKHPGGFEALNVKFISEFDCSLLGSTATSAR